MRRTWMVGNTTVTLKFEKPLRVKRWKGLHYVNGHRICGSYAKDGADLWPRYGVCLRCGNSCLGGADSYFSAFECEGRSS